MSTFLSVKNSLVTILETLKGAGNPLEEVYGWNNPNPEKFPCATVQTNDITVEKGLDTCRNELTLSYIVRVFIQDKRTEANEDERLELMEEVGDKLRENMSTISGTVLSLDILGYSPLYTQQDQTYCYFEINLAITVVKSIS